VQYITSQFPEEIAQTALASMLPLFSQVDVTMNMRAAELQQHATMRAALDQEESASTTAHTEQVREQLKTEVMTEATANEMLLKKVDGNDDWNKTVDKLNLSVQTAFASRDPKEHAQAILGSQVGKVYKTMFFDAYRQVERLQGILTERNIAIPTIDSQAPKTTPTSIEPGGFTAEDALAAVAANMNS